MLNLKNIPVILMCFSISQSVFSQDRTGLKTSIAVDLIGEFSGNPTSEASDQMVPRSIDLMFYAPIDHLFYGTFSLAAHREKGLALAELHEAFIGSDRIFPGMKFRLGQFFLGLGRLNRFHQHEWPFISTPIVQSRFFDKEGIIDNGIEFNYLFPLAFFLDLTMGVTNGFVYGHAHDQGEKPKTPTHYLHLLTFQSFGPLDVQPGISALKRVSSDGTTMQLFGFDLTGKIRTGKTLRFLWQSEVWQRSLAFDNENEEITTGAYFYPQYGFDSKFEIGLRYDFLTVNSLRDATGSKINNSESAIVPMLSYHPSEFSVWKLGYRFEKTKMDGKKSINNQVAEMQATYILGAHPSHEF